MMTENGLKWNEAVRFVLSRLEELNRDRKGFTVEECTGEILRLADSERERFGLLEKLQDDDVNKSVENMVSTALGEVGDTVAESGDRTLYQPRSPSKRSADNDHRVEDKTTTAPQNQKQPVPSLKDKENVESAIMATPKTDVKKENDVGTEEQAPAPEAKPEPKQKKKKATSTIKRDNSSSIRSSSLDKDHSPQTKSAPKKKNTVSSSKSEDSHPKKKSGRKPPSGVENNASSSDRGQSPDTKKPKKKSSSSAENHASSSHKGQSIDTKKTKKKASSGDEKGDEVEGKKGKKRAATPGELDAAEGVDSKKAKKKAEKQVSGSEKKSDSGADDSRTEVDDSKTKGNAEKSARVENQEMSLAAANAGYSDSKEWRKLYRKIIHIDLRRQACGPLRLSRGDKAKLLFVDQDGLTARGYKGYRSVRALYGCMSGDWYYEVEILPPHSAGNARIGVSTRRLELEAPAGSDKHSWSVRDVTGDLFHQARGEPYGKRFGAGDVIGCRISLPKISEELEEKIHKQELAHVEHRLLDLRHGKAPGDVDVFLDGAFLEFFKNGESWGIAQKGLPANRYYPTLSLYKESHVRINFGPDFKFPPPAGVAAFSAMERDEPRAPQQDEQDTTAPRQEDLDTQPGAPVSASPPPTEPAETITQPDAPTAR
ncbi:hypothetical protein NDN08_000152 [Rhodosorus marinus]|uniref:B30.2/SPRY domain-containing protein n=1 Tax=Rhodosorus marinus TaxID=101924 RepID=A0AAV8UH42_9RHOD|nr:hypothetical protein NDN08_000152 [Rhodosorus marinus]